MSRLVFVAVFAFPVVAQAHRKDLSYVAISEDDRTIVVKIDLDPHDTPLVERLDRNGDGSLTPQEIEGQNAILSSFVLGRIFIKKPGELCAQQKQEVTAYYADVQMWHVEVVYDCPSQASEFTVYLGYIDALSRTHHAMLKVVSEGRVQSQSVVEFRHALIEPRSNNWVDAGLRFAGLGIHHIFSGLDHLAFVLALILSVTSVKRALVLLSAFTAAHSVSLALSAFEIVRLPERPVEVAIALSIAIVAFESLRKRDGFALRLVLTFMFGLVHGHGFAVVLAEALFASAAFTWSLATFNIGIELGQAWLVLCVLPGLISMFGARHRSRVLVGWCLAPLAIGIYASWGNAAAVAAFLGLVMALFYWKKTRNIAAKIASVALGLCGLGWAAMRLLATP